MGSWLLWALPLAGLGQLLLVRDNLRVFQAEVPGDPATGSVAVLIPARDEAPRIAAVVRAVLDQPGVAKLRVWDDESSDGTGEAARLAAAGDPRFELLTGVSKPAGWTGKNHACWQLAKASSEDWLVFIDADVALAPGAVSEAVRQASATGSGLLSFWPRQRVPTPGEQLLVPMLDVILLGFLPMRLAATSPDPALAAANGQCLVFAREAYEASGGHAAVAGDPVDDVALARAIKRVGRKLVTSDAGAYASVRMYGGFSEAWAGFTKNLFPAFGGQVGPFLVGVSLFGLLHALPLPGLILGLWLGGWAPMAAQLVLSLALRVLLALELGHPRRAVLLHPVGALCVLALAVTSWRASATGRTTWKGRVIGA